MAGSSARDVGKTIRLVDSSTYFTNLETGSSSPKLPVPPLRPSRDIAGTGYCGTATALSFSSESTYEIPLVLAPSSPPPFAPFGNGGLRHPSGLPFGKDHFGLNRTERYQANTPHCLQRDQRLVCKKFCPPSESCRTPWMARGGGSSP